VAVVVVVVSQQLVRVVEVVEVRLTLVLTVRLTWVVRVVDQTEVRLTRLQPSHMVEVEVEPVELRVQTVPSQLTAEVEVEDHQTLLLQLEPVVRVSGAVEVEVRVEVVRLPTLLQLEVTVVSPVVTWQAT
jgi:hypothetical protein